MGADEIVKALRCDVEQGNEGGSRCYREGEDCRNCPNYYEGGDHIMTIDEMMLAAADAIESLQAQIAAERAKYAELQRHNVDCTKRCVELQVQLSASQRQLQAAVEDIWEASMNTPCVVCAHGFKNTGVPCKGIPCCFEWRGPQTGKGVADGNYAR